MMKKQLKKIALGAVAAAAASSTVHAQSADALIDKLVQKGILTVKEANDLRDEADKNFTTAFQTKTGMPDWVTGYKLSGDFRGRMDDQMAGNGSFVDRVRFRYRIRAGVAVSMKDDLEVGLRLGSGDGGPLSNNQTLSGNGSKKNIYVDAAYGRWTPIHSGAWNVAATAGKMDQPFQTTPMIFDADYTPEGAAVQASYKFNDKFTLRANTAAFVLDEEKSTGSNPWLYGGQLFLDSTWSSKLESSLGFSVFDVASKSSLNPTAYATLPKGNQGNGRSANGSLLYNYDPYVVDGSITYKLDSFPFYTGVFPIKTAVEFIHNPGASSNNEGWWAGVTLGKSGTRGTWDITYRYERLEADAWYDQLVDDDFGAFYQNAPVTGSTGWVGGTNIKGHLIKLNYSFTDSFSFAFSYFMDDLINNATSDRTPVAEPNASASRFMADLMWKF